MSFGCEIVHALKQAFLPRNRELEALVDRLDARAEHIRSARENAADASMIVIAQEMGRR